MAPLRRGQLSWPLAALALGLGCGPTAGLEPTFQAPERDARIAWQLRAISEEVIWDQAARSWPELAEEFLHRHADPDEVMAALPLAPGETVVDLGCGAGFYTFRLAQRVAPQGQVLARDIDPRALEALAARGAIPGLDPHGSVQLQLSQMDDPALEPSSVDLVFMAHLDFYLAAELEPAQQRLLSRLVGALKPDGRVALLQQVQAAEATELHSIRKHFGRLGLMLQEQTQLEAGNSYLLVLEPVTTGGG